MTAMTSKILAGVAALTVLALPAVGDAQNAAQGTSRSMASDQPIAFGADSGEQTAERITLRGRAEVTQGQNRIRADAITLYRKASGDPDRVEATGKVYFVTPTQSMRGDRAVYAMGTGEVVVTGDVVLTQGQNVLTGGRLTYNVNTDAATMAGAPRGAAGNRIQGVFYPSSN